MALPFGPALRVSDSHTFFDDDQLICCDIRVLLYATVWPVDLEVGGLGCGKPEVKSGIIRRVEAALTHHLLCLLLPAIVREYASSNRTAV